jgi:hypothetical protein
MNISKHEITVTVIYIEIFFIVLAVVLILALKLMQHIKATYITRLDKKLQFQIYCMIYKKKSFRTKNIKKSLRRLDVLVPVMLKIDNEHNPLEWHKERVSFIEKIILPLAQDACNSKDVYLRALAAKAFCLTNTDNIKHEKCILKLVNDEIPIVASLGIQAALKYCSLSTLHAAVESIAKMQWRSQFSNIKIFTTASPQAHKIIIKILESTQDVNVRILCYNILLRFPASKTYRPKKEDLESPKIGLKIVTLKFISHIDKEAAIPRLIQALNDPHWEVRLVAIHRLSLLRAEESVQLLAGKLQDSEWWVKQAAAQSLRTFGEIGDRILNENGIVKDDIILEHPHISNLWW